LEPETLVLSNSGATLGIPGILKIRGCINDGVVSFVNISSEIERDFLYYFWTTQTTRLLVQQSGYGQPNLNIDIVSNIRFPLPPLSEQEQIVSYLDDKTTKIDELIQKKLRKIDLLKEYRTSLINTVVTKGLNPNVPMKDSGIEWIGEIPSHWEVNKLNRYIFFQEGPGLRSFQFTDEGVKVICVTNITENGIDFTYRKYISIDEYLQKYQHFTVKKGDYLLSSSGNSWGKVSEYLDNETVILNTSTIRLNTINNDLLKKTLIKYILKSDYIRNQLDLLMTGSCQPNFGPTHLDQLFLTLPPLSEQEQIVSYLDEKTLQIDKTIDIEKKKIELLKEYRQSLISNVVTGKIKVIE
jgi:type I restriction enzyme S subunit